MGYADLYEHPSESLPMSADAFVSIADMLNAGTTEREIANRIDHGDLYWRDSYGREARAGENEATLVHEALAKHLAMKRAAASAKADTSQKVQFLERDPVERYWDLWAELGESHAEEHVLVSGGFIVGDAVKIDKDLKTTERNSLLRIIAALCHKSGIKPSDHGSAVRIAKLTEDIGATVTDDTVRKVLGQVIKVVEMPMK